MGEAINLVENFKVEKVIFNCGEFNELEQILNKILIKRKYRLVYAKSAEFTRGKLNFYGKYLKYSAIKWKPSGFEPEGQGYLMDATPFRTRARRRRALARTISVSEAFLSLRVFSAR